MKKLLAITVLFFNLLPPFGGIEGSFSQNVGINEPNPDNSALIEMTSSERGLLIPRMTTVQRDAIASPAQSLLIYNITDMCLQIWEDAQWNDIWCSTPCVAPAITSHPVDVSINDGGNANYTVTATGTAILSYQWQESTDGGTIWSDISNGGTNPAYSGATTSSLTLINVPVSYDTYDYQCIVTNACGSATSNPANLTVSSSFICGTSTVDDIDGNTYNTVLIGSQCWLKENMHTTKYPDNSAITKGPSAHGDPGWTVDLAYYSCPPNTTNDGEDCAAPSLGLLYQWSAAMNGAASCNGTGSAQPECTTPVQGICPDGWHIPSHYEWTQLEQQICNDNGGGTCNTDFPYDITTTGWLGTNGEGSDMANHVADQNWTAGTLTGDANFTQSGLDVGPSGYRKTNGDYYDRSNSASLWSSAESGTSAWKRGLHYTMTSVLRFDNNKAYGFSVRCLKD